MSRQTSLLQKPPRYCVDTNVILSFLNPADDEWYDATVFPKHWQLIEKMIDDGEIIAPKEVEDELKLWIKQIPALGPWLKRRSQMFVSPSSDQLKLAKPIVTKYEAYGKIPNYLPDLMVMTLAQDLDLTVITLEMIKHHSTNKPKIPVVCAEFGIKQVNIKGFFKAEKFTG